MEFKNVLLSNDIGKQKKSNIQLKLNVDFQEENIIFVQFKFEINKTSLNKVIPDI